ncbi:hypothetical protein VSDG_00369 [Cytospora chrysosperma]|uniref:Cell morphogenesis protein N-terminal domain-containing protein n=1 Tax=Cytospora chrysosperma TaxID=252740 RepID=A0A423WPT1_CYTCH|nr:hypothetical protein VSDG_00369 [Valsa sordida]
MAPSSTLPDHAYDTLKFSPQSPIHEEDEDWDKAVRPGQLDPQTARYIAHSRESSLEKLQSGGLLAIPSAQTQSQSQPPSSASRIHAGPRLAAGGLFEPNVDPKIAASDEQKTVGEYALHVLFTSFIGQAEEKLNESITVPFEPEPQIDHICGPGVDPAFDQSIAALAHIASPRPKALIDSMMLWRKSKSDAANEARMASKGQALPGPLQRRNTEPVQPNGADSMHSNGPASLSSRQEFVAQAERRSLVSIYILCRVLLEVISQSTLPSITPEMEEKLEGIIFSQLKIADTDQLLFSPLKLANWNLFAQLLGVMSEINFESVTERFIVDLDRSIQEHGILKSPMSGSRDAAESKIELVLGGMKHLRLKVSPPGCWEQTCNFMIALGKLFGRSHGQKVKSAFCQMLEMLLLPIAAKANGSDFSHPKWAEVLSNISPRLAQIFVKPRHWHFAFPLTATMLCVSPPETFSSQWLQLVYPMQTKLKDRVAKPICLQVLSRLVWTYLMRTTDIASGTTKKLDEVIKLILPPGRRSVLASDTAVAEPLIQIIRIIGFRQPEYCFKNIIFPLLNADQFSSNKELKIENLDPDKMLSYSKPSTGPHAYIADHRISNKRFIAKANRDVLRRRGVDKPSP